MKQLYHFVLWSDVMNHVNVFGDGIYNGLYNKEPAIIRVKEGEPVTIQFIEGNAIFDKRGILLSSVEILLPIK